MYFSVDLFYNSVSIQAQVTNQAFSQDQAQADQKKT